MHAVKGASESRLQCDDYKQNCSICVHEIVLAQGLVQTTIYMLL